MIHVQTLDGDLHKGHLGSDDITRSHQKVFANSDVVWVMQWIEKGSGHVCMFVCMYISLHVFWRFLETESTKSTESVTIWVGSWINALLRDVFSAVMFPARAWPVIVVPMIGLALWSRQLPSWLHVIFAQILRYKTEELRRIRYASMLDFQSA